MIITVRSAFNFFAVLLAFAVVLGIAFLLRDILGYLLVAAFLTIVIDPVIRKIESWGVSRGKAISVFALGVVLTLTTLGFIFVPPLVDQTRALVDLVPDYVNEIKQTHAYELVQDNYISGKENSSLLTNVLQTGANGFVGVISGVIGGALSAIIILLMTIFLLVDGKRLVLSAKRIFPARHVQKHWHLVETLYTNVSLYMFSRFFVALIGSSALLVTMFIFQMPSILPLALWMFVWGLIPMVGASIGSLPAIVIAFLYDNPLIGGHVVTGIAFVLYIIIYQQIENSVVEPKIVGRKMSLPLFVVFLSIMAGGALGGLIGALCAIPVISVIKIVLDGIAERNNPSLPPAKGPPADPNVQIA